MYAELATRLAANHGLIRVRDAVPAIVSRAEFLGLVERGDLLRLHQGVYRHAAVPVTQEQRIRAALLAVGDAAVLSHRAAVARHRVRNFQCALIEITHRSTSKPIRRGIVVHRSRTLTAADVVRIDGVPTTTAARTLIDVGAALPVQLVARYAQEWFAERKCTDVDVLAAMARAGRHPGVAVLRAALGDVVAEADSSSEARLGLLLTKVGLPPEHHVLVTTAVGDTFEIDWAYPKERIGLELDGYGVHLRSRAIYEHDRERRNELEIEGWRILNFTDAQCRRPSRVADQVRRALAAGVSSSSVAD